MTDTGSARILRILRDPAISGDLLLVAVAMAAQHDLGLECDRDLAGMGELLWPALPPRVRKHRAVQALRSDIRTYRPPPPTRTCTAPMDRRDSPCGRPAVAYGYLTDWGTGEKQGYGGCRRHRAWADAAHRANQAATPPDPPLPYANHGGALREHFPQVAWEEFWRQLEPSWRRHPESAAWPKPTLRLVIGDGIENTSDRPMLTVVTSPTGRSEQAELPLG